MQRGILLMLFASLLFSLMNACVYAAVRAEPALDSTVVSFIRVWVNLTLLLIPALLRGQFGKLFGDGRRSLWLRGLFGASALMLSFAAIARIGVGEAAFLHSSSGVFVALLSPRLLGQRAGWLAWSAILGAVLGLWLLLVPRWQSEDAVGSGLALGAGLLAALAYLMVARSGRSNPPATVVFYFCLLGVVLHLAYFAVVGMEWPHRHQAWLWSLGAGVFATGAQLCMTLSYRYCPAALLSAVGYASPVFSLGLAVWWFGEPPSALALLGCGLVLVCGVALPLVGTPAGRARPSLRAAG